MTRRPAIAALLLAAALATPAWAGDLSDPEAAVEAGREALSSQWDANWYDSKTDGFSPVDLPRPKPPRKPWGIWKWFDGLFSGFGWDFGEVLVFLMWLAAAGLLLWIVVALIRSYQKAELTDAFAATEQVDARAHLQRVEALPVTLEEEVDNYLQAARRAYESGDLSRAIVYLFSHQLLELDRSARLRLVKGKTNRQYLRELRSGGGAAGRLAEILGRTVRVFEAAFFGAHPPTPAVFESCWAEAAEFDRLISTEEEDA